MVSGKELDMDKSELLHWLQEEHRQWEAFLEEIGPTRMDYEHTMTAVSYIARLFDKILNESE